MVLLRVVVGVACCVVLGCVDALLVLSYVVVGGCTAHADLWLWGWAPGAAVPRQTQ